MFLIKPELKFDLENSYSQYPYVNKNYICIFFLSVSCQCWRINNVQQWQQNNTTATKTASES